MAAAKEAVNTIGENSPCPGVYIKMKKSKDKNDGKSSSAWFIETARALEAVGDPCAAKSWLLTGKSLFPKSFNIHYEEFIMERSAGRIQKCARLFYDMIHIFPKEKTLWEELARIFYCQDAIRLQNADTLFLKEMFNSLPMTHQKELLLKYANHHTDLIDKCKISLLVLKRFEGAVKDQAAKLILKLKAAEDKESPKSPLNIYRKMIVCDILPLILKNPATQLAQQASKHKETNKQRTMFVTEEQMLEYLNLMTEFYIACVVSKSNFEPGIDLASLELDETISSWLLIHENMVQFANKLNWSNYLKIKDKIDPAKNKPLKSRWKTISNAKESKHPMAIFYAVLQLHLLAVLEYCSSVLKSETNNNSNSVEYVLLESISTTNKETTSQSVIRTPKKKRKTDESGGYSSDYQSSSEDVVVVVNPGLLGKVSENLGESLQVAIDSYNFLTTNYRKEYEYIRSAWKLDSWDWLNTFHVDSLLYQGKFRKMIERVQTVQGMNQLKHDLRLMCSLYCSGQRKNACEKGFDIIASIPQSAFEKCSLPDDSKSNIKSEGRNLVILSTNPTDVLLYVVQILFATLKNGLYTEGKQRDATIGHLLVLSQLSWSKNEEFFLHLLKLIQAQDDGFNYELFFTYIIQIDILEEFAFLHSIDSINLVLSQTEDTTSKRTRTVTRGVNKEVEGGFKSSIMKQVQRSHESVCQLIANFLRTERDTILEALT